MKKTKVMIYAYTNINLGDDLMIRILCERYTDTNFVIYADSAYKKVFAKQNNLEVFSNSNLVGKAMNLIGRAFHITNAYERHIAKTCDACVCITGSLFIQGGDDWQNYITYMKSRQIDRIPYFQIGSNFGPYSDQGFYDGFKEYFAKCADVCFREKYSYDLFSDLPNVRYAPDVVFNGEFISKPAEKIVSVSVIDLEHRPELAQYQNDYIYFLIDQCCEYINRGYLINLMSFCKAEGDEKMVNRLSKLLYDKGCSAITTLYDGNIDEVLDIISRSEIVIATRFHASIIGWCMGKKVLPIIYSNKTQHVIDDLGYLGDVVTINNITGKDINAIPNMLSSYDSKNNQFDKLDLFIGKGAIS